MSNHPTSQEIIKLYASILLCLTKKSKNWFRNVIKIVKSCEDNGHQDQQNIDNSPSLFLVSLNNYS